MLEKLLIDCDFQRKLSLLIGFLSRCRLPLAPSDLTQSPTTTTLNSQLHFHRNLIKMFAFVSRNFYAEAKERMFDDNVDEEDDRVERGKVMKNNLFLSFAC